MFPIANSIYNLLPFLGFISNWQLITAEAFATVVLENLNSLIQRNFGLLWVVNKEMDKLSSTLSTILAVLEDAEEKQLKDRAIKNWLRKLNDVSFELDDILDDCKTEAIRWDYNKQKSRSIQLVQYLVLSCFQSMNVSFSCKIANRMKELRKIGPNC